MKLWMKSLLNLDFCGLLRRFRYVEPIGDGDSISFCTDSVMNLGEKYKKLKDQCVMDDIKKLE